MINIGLAITKNKEKFILYKNLINDSVQCSNNDNCLFVNDICIERSLASTIINSR